MPSSALSSSSMPITHYCQFLLTLVLFIFQTKVQANELIIESECQKDDYPEVCIQCLKSHQDINTNNITANILDCANKHVNNLASSFSNLLFFTNHENVTFLTIKNCIILHFIAKASLLGSLSKLIVADWVGAHVGVLTAAASLIKCHLQLDAGKSNVKFKYPPSLLTEMNVADQLTDAANKMIEKKLPK